LGRQNNVKNEPQKDFEEAKQNILLHPETKLPVLQLGLFFVDRSQRSYFVAE